MCCTWFAHDCALAIWVYVLETVHGTVRRLWKSWIAPFFKVIFIIIICHFREIFDVLDLMKMDMANFTIQQIRPYLQQQSVEYERKKFNEFLKTQEGDYGLLLYIASG